LNPKLKSALKYLLFISIGGFLFYLAFRNTEFEKLMADFRKADYTYVILSIIMGYLAFISRGMRAVLLLEPLGKKPHTWNAIHSISIGYFSNLLVPRAGEVARCTALSKSDKIPVDRLIGTVILERVIDMIMLLLLVALTLAVKFDELARFFTETLGQNQNADNSGLAIKLIIAAVALGLFLLAYFLRHRFVNIPGYHKVRNFWNGIKEGLKSIGKLRKKGQFIGHTLFIWAMYYFMVYVCIFALPATANLSMGDGLFVMIVAGMGMVVPTPGGIGSYHYLVMMGLSVLGISQADGVSFATLVHTGQLIMTIFAGIIAFAAMYRFNQKMKSNENIFGSAEGQDHADQPAQTTG